MKQNEILKQLVTEAESDPNVTGYLVFGSVAAGTQRADSDIDVITILRGNKPPWGMNNSHINGIKVGNLFLTYAVLFHSVETVPYLLHPLWGAKLLFDRDGVVKPLHEQIKTYFAEHPDIMVEWNKYYRQLKDEKAQYGCEQTTILEVWNDLEKRYSGGRIRRRFFNSFYLTNSRIFRMLKRFL
jgi:hypothetical protein